MLIMRASARFHSRGGNAVNDEILFSGFPEEGLHFLEELARNNNRDWFNARKEEYQSYVLRPAQDFVAALGERLKTLSAGIRYDTRTSGRGSIFRIYRDIRFSKDKTPYNTNVRMVFWEGEGKKTENPGYFVSVEPGGARVLAGLWVFPKPLLTAYRDAVVDEGMGEELEEALKLVEGWGSYEIGGKHYKRVPRGYDAGHTRAELLKYNGLYAHSGEIERQVIVGPELVEVCFEHCQRMAPLQQWIVKARERFGVGE